MRERLRIWRLIWRGAMRWVWLTTCARLQWQARREYLIVLGAGHLLTCRAVRLPGSGPCTCGLE